ncbi:DCAF6 factor, partial [Acromyrmex heyeri]
MRKTRVSIFRDIYYQPYDDCTKLKLYSSSKASLQLMQRMSLLKRLKVHNGCVNSICWNSNGELILSGSDDQHLVLTNAHNYEVHLYAYKIYLWTLSKRNLDVLIPCQRAVTALSVNPVLPHQIAIGCSDSTVRTFDRRTLGTPATGWTDAESSVRPLCSFTVPEFEGNSYRITSLSYSPDGQDVLVSYSSDHLYLFSIKDQGSLQLRKDATTGKGKGKKHPLRSPQPVRRLRLRGDWSDTGPDARPEREGGRRSGTEIAQARPVLHTSLMQRMTDVLSRMLNDPATRAALSGGGEDSLEGVIEQPEGIQNVENNPELNTERSSDTVEMSAEQRNTLETNENTSTRTDRVESTDMDETINTERLQTGELEQSQEYNQLASPSISTSMNDDVPMETDSSQSDRAQITSIRCTTSRDRTEHDNVWNRNRNEDEASCGNITSKQENMMENLQDRLTTMRDGFLERHGSEPAVSLTYSDKSSTNATISLGVGDEMTRDSYHPGPSGSSDGTLDAGPSSNRNHHYNDNTKEDVYIDSDDEDIQSDERLLNPVEEMDEAITNARSSQGHETFDDACLTELCVKRKYMGHRNARTMIKEANFWGNDFVMSGSDCGHVFVWERDTARLCMLLEADQHVVNCLQPHPYLPMLATSGIDYDVKLWAPVNDEPNFDEKFAEDLKKRNAVMLEETKDTITVPAVFMIRMLACLNQIRRGSENL